MTSIQFLLAERLRTVGYRERRAGMFEAPSGRRIVALVDASTSPADWQVKTASTIRLEPFATAPVWCRYVVVAVDSARNTELAIAAASFCRDVSKCRRLIAFRNQKPDEVLPFLGLAEATSGSGTPGHDVTEVVSRIIKAPNLAAAFLDDSVPQSRVQAQAEEPED